jgi:hypothetical protein
LPVGRQQSDGERGGSHQAERDQESILAAPEIAYKTEHDRPERTDCESRGEREQREHEGARVVDVLEKKLRLMITANEP